MTYEDGTECSKTWVRKVQTPGNHLKERIQIWNCYDYELWRMTSVSSWGTSAQYLQSQLLEMQLQVGGHTTE